MGKRLGKKEKKKREEKIPPFDPARVSGVLGEVERLLDAGTDADIADAVNLLLSQEELVLCGVISELVEKAGPEAATFLERLYSYDLSKRARKEVKKAAFILGQRGIKVQLVEGEKKPVWRLPEKPKPLGAISRIDSSGNYIIIIAVPEIVGMRLVEAVANDMQGVIEIKSNIYRQKFVQRHFQQLTENAESGIVEIDPGYCLNILKELKETQAWSGLPLPEEYGEIMQKLLVSLEELPQNPVYQIVDTKGLEDSRSLVLEGGSLLDSPSFPAWRLPADLLGEYVDKYIAAKESKIIVSQQTESARFDDIFAAAIERIFDTQMRKVFKDRLEKMAYYYAKTGDEYKARVCLATALDIAKGPKGILSDKEPFLVSITRLSIIEAAEKRKTNGEQRIIKP